MEKTNSSNKTKFLLISAYILTAIVCIICQFACYKFSMQGFVNCIIIAVICIIISIIIHFFYKVKAETNSEPNKEENENLSEVDKYIKSLKPSEKSNAEYCKRILENKAYSYLGKKLKLIALGFLGFIVMGALFVPMLIFGVNTIKDISGNNYVKTQAIIREASYDANKNSSKLAYSYMANDGKIYTSRKGATFGGAIFKAGKTITIYYEASNPENIITPTKIFIFFFIASLAIILGVGFIINGFLGNSGSALGLSFCLKFIIASFGLMIATMLAGGLSFFEVLGCGILPYIYFCFIIISILILSIFARTRRFYKQNKTIFEDLINKN